MVSRALRLAVLTSGLATLGAFELHADEEKPKYSDWSTPVNLGPVVNSASGDQWPFIAKTGLSLYFASNRPGGSGLLDIYVSQRESVQDPWGSPQNLGTTINSGVADHCPFVTPDGHTLIFVSNRAGTNDFYMSRRRDKRDDFAWGPPTLIAELNSAFDEFGPWGYNDDEGDDEERHDGKGRDEQGHHEERDDEDDDENRDSFVFFFTSNRGGGPHDIYTSVRGPDGTFSEPQVVPELSSPAADTFPVVRRDGLEIFLTSNRTGSILTPAGVPSFDIWTATRASTSEPWSTPVNVAAVNSEVADQRSALSWDARTMILFSNRPGSLGNDLYESTRRKLKRRD